MAYKSFRKFVEELDAVGELSHVTCEVDWDSEIGSITRAIFKRKGPAVLFENVKDSRIPLFCGAMHEAKKFGMMLDISDNLKEQCAFLTERLSKTIAPVIVSEGPCQENVLLGDDIDLYMFPTPKWHPNDGGRFIGTMGCFVTEDPETGIPNVAVFRSMIEGKNKIGFNSEQQNAIHLRMFQAKKENMPFAMSISAPPAVVLSSSSKVPYGIDEYAVSGSIAGEPIPLVKCKTNDLHVPADAEIVIEGYVPWDMGEWLLEGPYGEFTGHFSSDQPSIKPTGIVTCVTYRNNPIMQGTCPGVGPNEQTALMLRAYGGSGLASLKASGIPGVKDLSVLEMGCASFVWAVSITSQFYGGHAAEIANFLMSRGHFPKILVLVDEDIDVFDPGLVLWAVASRVQPARDIRILPANQVSTPLDPSLPDEQREKGLYCMTSRMIIDATKQNKGVTFSKLVYDTEEAKAKVEERWAEYGFPIPY
jgi:4-hydroxy-3-polyprenylbenzoate decarboxylase